MGMPMSAYQVSHLRPDILEKLPQDAIGVEVPVGETPSRFAVPLVVRLHVAHGASCLVEVAKGQDALPGREDLGKPRLLHDDGAPARGNRRSGS